jgi:3-oxoacyl-[acyl-carrier protein] reductase
MTFFQSLAGRIALVAGGSLGAGPAIVKRLADYGALVVFTHPACGPAGEELVSRIEATGGTAVAIQADSSAQREVEAAIAETVARFGRIDIFVNNAEQLVFDTEHKLALEPSKESVLLSASALFALIKAVISHMPVGGRIIATGCFSAAQDRCFQSSKSVTTSPAANVSRGLARDLEPRGITVNFVQPSATKTPSFTHDSAVLPRAKDPTAAQLLDDVASLVAYLASEEAGFITGVALFADGGYPS